MCYGDCWLEEAVIQPLVEYEAKLEPVIMNHSINWYKHLGFVANMASDMDSNDWGFCTSLAHFRLNLSQVNSIHSLLCNLRLSLNGRPHPPFYSMPFMFLLRILHQ